MRDIGVNIQQIRQAKNMTQESLAQAIHSTRQTVSNYETGRSRPDADTLILLAEVLEVPVEALLYGPAWDRGAARRQTVFFVAVLLLFLLCAISLVSGVRRGQGAHPSALGAVRCDPSFLAFAARLALASGASADGKGAPAGRTPLASYPAAALSLCLAGLSGRISFLPRHCPDDRVEILSGAAL